MADTPNISFIPKKPLAKEGRIHRPASLLITLAIGILVAVWLVFTGLYFYNGVLDDQISTQKEQLRNLSTNYDKKLVDQAKAVELRLRTAKDLLNGHIAMSPIFAFLEDNVPKTGLLETFDFRKATAGQNGSKAPEGFEIAMNVVSPGFSQAANLRNALSGHPGVFSSVAMSNVALTPVGEVGFNFEGILNPSFINYEDQVKQYASGGTGTATTTESASSTSSTSGGSGSIFQ